MSQFGIEHVKALAGAAVLKLLELLAPLCSRHEGVDVLTVEPSEKPSLCSFQPQPLLWVSGEEGQSLPTASICPCSPVYPLNNNEYF